MSPAAAIADEPELDIELLDEMVTKIGGDFASAGQPSIIGYISDPRVSPTLLTMAVVRAHLLGAASMMATTTESADGLEAVAWLMEAFAEARAVVRDVVTGGAA